MSEPIILRTVSEWVILWSDLAGHRTQPCYLFKHSPYCPTSRFVESIVRTFAEEILSHEAIALYQVDVVNKRDVARAIAEDTGVRHHSPQVLLLGPNRTVKWHASHHAIHDGVLRESLNRALEESGSENQAATEDL